MTTVLWDRAKQLADKHASSNGLFVRLANDGEKAVGVFCGAPYAREVLWTGDKYVPYEENNAEHKGKRPSLRVAINFYSLDDGDMKIIEGGSQWFRDIAKVREKYGLDKWQFEIERHGASGDTKTTYSILPEQQVDAGLREKIAKHELHDLEKVLSGVREDNAPVPNPSIDPATAVDVIARLKALPRAAIDGLLAEFDVQRVKDIKAGDVARFKDAIAKHESGDINPFE